MRSAPPDGLHQFPTQENTAPSTPGLNPARHKSSTIGYSRKSRRPSQEDDGRGDAIRAKLGQPPRPRPTHLLSSSKGSQNTYAYASLPSTPLPLLSPPATEDKPTFIADDPVPFSLWEYLREEVLATDFDSHQEMKWERVSNFLSVPLAVERVRIVDLLRIFSH